MTQYVSINFCSQETPSDWSIETTKESLVPMDLLTAYIEKLDNDQTVDAEESAMFVFLLKSFIHHLKPPSSFPKGGC